MANAFDYTKGYLAYHSGVAWSAADERNPDFLVGYNDAAEEELEFGETILAPQNMNDFTQAKY